MLTTRPGYPGSWQAGRKVRRNPLVFVGKVCLPPAKKWQETGRQDKEPEDARSTYRAVTAVSWQASCSLASSLSRPCLLVGGTARGAAQVLAGQSHQPRIVMFPKGLRCLVVAGLKPVDQRTHGPPRRHYLLETWGGCLMALPNRKIDQESRFISDSYTLSDTPW
jgi:hypothetical protein